MMSLFEASFVIARRDFVASVFSRTFILFLIAPVLLFGFAAFFGTVADSQDRAALHAARASRGGAHAGSDTPQRSRFHDICGPCRDRGQDAARVSSIATGARFTGQWRMAKASVP